MASCCLFVKMRDVERVSNDDSGLDRRNAERRVFVAEAPPAFELKTVDGQTQSIPGGAIASQEAIKEVGQNGGGPYNANSAHPFENPNPISNTLQIWMLLAIPFAFPWMFGKLAGSTPAFVSRGSRSGRPGT